MSRVAYTVNMLVRNPRKPEWGPGKVVRVESRAILVVFRDAPGGEAKRMIPAMVPLEVCEQQHDPLLDNIPPLVEANGTLRLPKDRITFQEAESAFLVKFPLGFEDPGYIGNSKSGERYYKWAAHQHFVEKLGGCKYRELLESDAAAVIVEIKRCVSKVNLLSPMSESPAFSDALRDPAQAMPFLTTLADLLDADRVTEDVYVPYVTAVGMLPAERGRVNTWPVATILPYLARPDIHMFLKPTVTRQAAEALGFHLNYLAQPNWLTYSRLLEMSRIYKDKLAAWKPRDMIDMQSFFWVACGGYSKTGS